MPSQSPSRSLHSNYSPSLWTPTVTCPQISTKYLLNSFGPMLGAPSVLVVTWERGQEVLCGIPGHQRQVQSLQHLHCCTCTASCKASPPSIRVVPAIVIPVTCNSNNGLQQFKGISLTISTLVPLDHFIVLNIVINSSICS